jgi:eukaryotic-like serine/threonine-protein kinase
MKDRKGQQFVNYHLIDLLGSGSFGEVYLARDPAQTLVAIKLLLKLTQGVPQGFVKQEFIDEVEKIFLLKHSHIVQLLHFGVEKHESIPFIVMEYAPKGTLRECYPSGTRVPLPRVVSYVKQIAGALQYVHNEGLIHRDIKPANLLIRGEGDIVLSDFGIATTAHREQSLITQKIVLGSPAYMAPEQIEGKPRHASDQYALAITTYEWLCGCRPFQGDHPLAIFSQHLSTPPPPLRNHVPTLPEEVEMVVLKALAKEPQSRFDTIQQFADALKEASASGQPQSVVILEDFQPDLKPEPSHSSESEDEGNNLLSSSSPLSRRPGISRRGVIFFLGLAGLVGAIGGSAWVLTWERRPHSVLGQTPAPPPIPLGKVLYTYRGHAKIVNAATWSPDGRRIASGSLDHTVQVWEAADGSHAFTYRGHSDSANAVTWSLDGRRIASGSNDTTVQVWDAADGGHVFTYRGHAAVVLAVAWSPDGKYIASGGVDNSVQVWDASDGCHVFTYRGHAKDVNTVVWSPDSKRIASGSYDQTVQVWDATDGSPVFTYRGHSNRVNAVAWSPDGSRIASGSDDTTVQVWNAADGGHVFTYKGHSNLVEAVAWSPDSKRIVSGSYNQIAQVWDAADGRHAYTFRRHSAIVDAVAWSPDSRRIASGSYDQTVQVWGAG